MNQLVKKKVKEAKEKEEDNRRQAVGKEVEKRSGSFLD
jgi:hypothetical protein